MENDYSALNTRRESYDELPFYVRHHTLVMGSGALIALMSYAMMGYGAVCVWLDIANPPQDESCPSFFSSAALAAGFGVLGCGASIFTIKLY
jgi:hypothetical protein